MGMGLETTETMILEIGGSLLALGMALITGWLVGGLLTRHQYGVVFPLGLILAAVALLLWWEPLVRVVVSFSLLLIGYLWLFAWWRASHQGNALVPSLQSRFAREEDRFSGSMIGALAGGRGHGRRVSTTRTMLEMSQTGEATLLTEGEPIQESWPYSESPARMLQTELYQAKENQDDRYHEGFGRTAQPRPDGAG